MDIIPLTMAPVTDKQQLSGQLSLSEHISLLYELIAIFGSGLYNMVTGIFRGSRGATKYRLHVGRAMFRTLSSRLSWKQLQYDANSAFLLVQIFDTRYL